MSQLHRVCLKIIAPLVFWSCCIGGLACGLYVAIVGPLPVNDPSTLGWTLVVGGMLSALLSAIGEDL